MFGVAFPPTFLSGENRGQTGRINNPARTNCPGAVAGAKCYGLFFPGSQLHVNNRCGTQNLRASNTGATEHFFIKRSTIKLIRRHTYLIKRPKFACLRECLYFAVCKPKPQSLLRRRAAKVLSIFPGSICEFPGSAAIAALLLLPRKARLP